MRSLACTPLDRSAAQRQDTRVEVFLLLWDEMDDWIGAATHLLRGLTGNP